MSDIVVRAAQFEDWPDIVHFNQLLAEETEDKQLDPDSIRLGVQELLSDPEKGRYFVACSQQAIVGQLMHTWEWSDWRNGQIWWLQSVYVRSDFRRNGVFRRLYGHLEQLAKDDPGVVGLRLYVEQANHRAQQTYERLGMNAAGYAVMEQLFARDAN